MFLATMNRISLQRVLPIVFGLVFFNLSCSSQIVYEISYFDLYTLDTSMPSDAGKETSYKEQDRSGASGLINIYEDHYTILPESSYGDIKVNQQIKKVKKKKDKRIYLSKDRSELCVFNDTVVKGKRFYRIEFNTEYNRELKLFSQRFIYETFLLSTKDSPPGK